MRSSPQDGGSWVGPERPLGGFLARKFARSTRMNYSKYLSFNNYIHSHYHCSSNFPVERLLSTTLVSGLSTGSLPPIGIYSTPYLRDPALRPGGFQASRAALPGRGPTTGRLSRRRPRPRGDRQPTGGRGGAHLRRDRRGGAAKSRTGQGGRAQAEGRSPTRSQRCTWHAAP